MVLPFDYDEARKKRAEHNDSQLLQQFYNVHDRKGVIRSMGSREGFVFFAQVESPPKTTADLIFLGNDAFGPVYATKMAYDLVMKS